MFIMDKHIDMCSTLDIYVKHTSEHHFIGKTSCNLERRIKCFEVYLSADRRRNKVIVTSRSLSPLYVRKVRGMNDRIRLNRRYHRVSDICNIHIDKYRTSIFNIHIVYK